MKRFILMLLLLPLLHTGRLEAQPIWIGAQEMNGLILEWQKPFLDQSDHVGFFMSSVFFSYRQRTSDAVMVHLELPMSNYDTESRSEFLFGNPYVGLVFGPKDALISGDFGVRLPLADDDKSRAATYGVISDFDRPEAFALKSVPVAGMVRLRTTFPASKLGLRAHFGPSVLIYTEKRGGDDMGVALKYGLIGTYEDEKVLAQLGFSGWYNASADRGDFGDNSHHQLGVSVNFDAGSRLWPGIILRIPMDKDLKEVIDLVVGLNMMVQL